MSLETDTATAPAYWASYLINGDASGIDHSDLQAADAWALKLAAKGWRIVGIEDNSEQFSHRNDAGTLAGDVCTYQLIRAVQS